MPKGYLHQILLIMRLTTIILIMAIMQVSASTFAQRVTLSEKKATLSQVFDRISDQCGYDFVFNSDLLKQTRPVTISVRNMELSRVLELILKDQPVSFSIEDKTVVVKGKETSVIIANKNWMKDKTIDVRGRVQDRLGNPIPGATVRVINGKVLTITSENGEFLLRDVDRDSKLSASSVGFANTEFKAAPDAGIIVLYPSNTKLDEVMVVGYGTTTKRLTTGSSSQVKGADLEQQPISNPILGLAGRVAGAFITQNAGYSGATPNVVIRGQNSLTGVVNGVTDPLYVIDGVPFGSLPIDQTSGSQNNYMYTFSPLNTIDPAQIESIDILKDADATAIYGSRGANGVVLITTKKGRSGATKVDADISSGFGNVTNKIKMLSTSEYLRIRRQAFVNDNITPNATNAPDLLVWDQTANTNIPDLLIGNTQHQTKATLSVSGGDRFTQFLLGGSFRRESTVLKSNTADKAVQFHANAQHASQDGKFGISTTISYNTDNNTVPNYSLNTMNYSLPPNYPLYNSDGSLYFGTGYTNPLAALSGYYNVKTDNLLANATLHYRVLPDLEIKVNAGYNYINTFGSTVVPATANNPVYNFQPQATLSNNFNKTYIAEPQINYIHTWGKGKLTALLGGTWQEVVQTQPYFALGTFSNNQLATSIAALDILYKTSGSSDYKYVSGFGRVEFEWDGKYLVSGNFRRDGSSRFGSNQPYGSFGSGAAAWIFSRESLISGQLPWLSFGKIKMSYGVVGNDKTLSDYAYLSTYGTDSPYGPVPSLRPFRIQNPYLQWEVNKKFDAAIDLGFLKDRIFLTAGYYRNLASHLLASNSLANQTGFGYYQGNLPEGAVVRNRGFEFELSTVNLRSKTFSWSSSLNFTASQNKLLSFPDLLASSYASNLQVGQSLNTRFVYHSTGIINGIPTAQDINGDGVITPGLYANNGSGDRIAFGNNDPKYYGGFNNTFSYKGIALDFLFQFVKKTAHRGDLNFASYPGMNANLPQSLLDLPLKYSTSYGTPALNAYPLYAGSDASYEDASYIRLKNVSVAYNLPADWIKKLKMSGLQVYLRGQNLLTFTNYKGHDPETGLYQLPTLRMMVAGIKTTF